MFSKIRMKNFYSFADVEFNLSQGTNNYKPLAIVYGENGSGKTNLMLALSVFIDLMRTMDVRDVIEKILYDQDHPQDDSIPQHKLTPQVLSKLLRANENLFNECRMIDCAEPVFLQYEFVVNGKTGVYTVEFAAEGIVHERLEYVVDKRRGTYFDLSVAKKSINKVLFKSEIVRNDLHDQLVRYWGKHTFLAIIIHEMNDKSQQYIEDGFFGNFLSVLGAFSDVSCEIHNNSNGHSLISGQKNDLLLLDMESGRISKDDISRLERTQVILTKVFKAINSDNEELYYATDKSGDDRISYKLRIKKRIAGKIRDLPFSCESFGNHKIIDQIPFLMRALLGETVILDESDTGIHDLLYYKILGDLKGNISGQLIMTTHNTTLMEIPNIKDAVYIIKEDDNANRSVVPITVSGDRIYQQNSIRNKYISGNFGGIPRVDEIDFAELKRLLNE